MRTRWLGCITAVAAMVLLPLAVAAQPPAGGDGPAGPPLAPKGGPRMGGPGRARIAQERPAIAQKVREAANKVAPEVRKEAAEIEKNLDRVHAELKEALAARDEDRVMKLADRVGELETALRKLRLRAELRIAKEAGPETKRPLAEAARRLAERRRLGGRIHIQHVGEDLRAAHMF